MEGFNIDHSDSDSGDSWTILDNSPVVENVSLEIVENNPKLQINENLSSNIEMDEDTDGISIISDSDPESSTACEKMEDIHITDQNHLEETPYSPFISFHPLTPNAEDMSVSKEDDLLGDVTAKHKTYVHRRNKRLSTVLNIIMLGSVITAAGVAIGHMWGAKNDCSMHTTPSINKILSKLYKLQEENTYLRNKLKEFSVINSLHVQQKKLATADKIPFKQNRCKKIYEEPLNKNTGQHTKCIDSDDNLVDNNLNDQPIIHELEYDKIIKPNVENLKHIYQQNRSWLDEEVAKRMKHEKKIITKMLKSSLSSITEEQKVLQDESVNIQTNNQNDRINLMPNTDTDSNLTEKKVTYADSLKFDYNPQKVKKREISSVNVKENKNAMGNQKVKKHKDVTINEVDHSEEDFIKDDRYIGQKKKQEKKKRDRQKLHKKQKRRNKYEQWEMKGGYMKDYDDVSTSLQQSETDLKKSDASSQDFEKINYINELTETDSIPNLNNDHKQTQNKKWKGYYKSNSFKNDDSNWYDKRAALRTEARNKLEHELFGDTSPNNAVWYFRRMQKREQCRAKSDNNTYKKMYKLNKNYKMKL